MRVCNCLVSFIFFIFIAPVSAGSISCMDTADKNCDLIAKSEGADVYIYSSKQSSPVFSIPETESTVETFSFLKKITNIRSSRKSQIAINQKKYYHLMMG